MWQIHSISWQQFKNVQKKIHWFVREKSGSQNIINLAIFTGPRNANLTIIWVWGHVSSIFLQMPTPKVPHFGTSAEMGYGVSVPYQEEMKTPHFSTSVKMGHLSDAPFCHLCQMVCHSQSKVQSFDESVRSGWNYLDLLITIPYYGKNMQDINLERCL